MKLFYSISFFTGVILYGINILNRKKCIICNKDPPCLTLFPCKPSGYEGHFFYCIGNINIFLRNYFAL